MKPAQMHSFRIAEETHDDEKGTEVIRAASGMPIIRKFVDLEGHKIVESYMKPDELAYELRKLPPAQLALVRELLNGQVSEINPEAIRAHEQAQKEEAAEAQRLAQVYAAAQKLPVPPAVLVFVPSKTIGVAQHEVGQTNSNSARPILGSYGASSCWIVAIYNPATKTATLAHIDSFTPDSELSEMIAFMKGDSKQPLQIHIAGRGEGSEQQGSRLIDLINKRSDAKLATADIGRSASGDLAIDSRTGEVTNRVDVTSLDLGPHADQRVMRPKYDIQKSPLRAAPLSVQPQPTK